MTTTEPVLRVMTKADVAAVMRYEQDMFGAEAWPASAYRAEIADRRARHYCVVESTAGELLGWAGVLVQGTAAEIMTVGVVPAARGRGLGRRLLVDLLAAAVRRGAVEAFLEVRVDNPAAIALYEHTGFARVGLRRRYFDGGRVDGVTMHADLHTDQLLAEFGDMSPNSANPRGGGEGGGPR